MSGKHGPCPEVLPYCRYDEPFSDTHHLFWPRFEYTTPLEKRFREAEVNVIRGICRCIHDLNHLKLPPEKPSPEDMRGVVYGEA